MSTLQNIRLSSRHRSSGQQVLALDANLPFADYVMRTRAMLTQVHQGKHDAKRIVEGNAPFESNPSSESLSGEGKTFKRGVLLVHGLTDSPYHMRHLATFFQRNGFRVMAVLLPGHGTQPGDLLDVSWKDWAQTVAYGVERLAEGVEEVFLAGFSAGAALSVHHASTDERIRGLFLFSPAFEIDPRARWANLHKVYSWLIPAGAWVSVMPDRDIYKYESFCKNAAAQMYALTKALPQDDFHLPIFMAASADDATVDSSATLRFLQRARHHASTLVWYSTKKMEQNKVEWVDSAIPAQKILSSAHTAIVMSSEDGHYGTAGEYKNCLHYIGLEDERLAACESNERPALLGEVNEHNLRRGLMRRLTFNPHYAEMEVSMQRFLKEIS
jgi:esterase/lipase